MISFFIAFAFIALFIGFWVVVVVKRGVEFKQLATSGVETKATIVVKATVRVGKRRRPALTYEFTDPMGKLQRRRVYVTQALYNGSQEGVPIAVIYLPEKPAVNALKSDIDDARSALAKRSA